MNKMTSAKMPSLNYPFLWSINFTTVIATGAKNVGCVTHIALAWFWQAVIALVTQAFGALAYFCNNLNRL